MKRTLEILNAIVFVFVFLNNTPAQFACATISSAQYDELRRALTKDKGTLSQGWCNYNTGNYTSCSDANYTNKHPGVDIADAVGTPVYSTTGGKVVRKSVGSNCQTIDCLSTLAIYNSQNDKTYIYLHMDTIIVNVNDTVTAGQQIGTIGKRGPVSGAHIHYEVRAGQKTAAALCVTDTVNPYTNTPFTSSVTSWEFNTTNNFEGWSLINIDAGSVNGGNMFMDPWGNPNDPYFVSPNISADASAYRWIKLRMASNGLDSSGSIYFKTQAENSFSPDKRVDFTVANCRLCGNAPFQDYTIYMGGNSKWTGTVTGIRLDPTGAGQGGTNLDSIGVDYIRLSTNP